MKVTFSVLIGHEVESSHVFSGPGLYVIGRHPGSAIRLYDGKCSRRHGLILVGKNSIRLRELGSANGTQVDGITVGGGCPPGPPPGPEDEDTVKEVQNFPEDITGVHDVILRDCTLISIGNTKIRVMMDEDAQSAGGLLTPETLEGRPVEPNEGPLKLVGVEARLDFSPVGKIGGTEKSLNCDVTEITRKAAKLTIAPEDLAELHSFAKPGTRRGASLYLYVLEMRRVLPMRGTLIVPPAAEGEDQGVGIEFQLAQAPPGVTSIFANLFG